MHALILVKPISSPLTSPGLQVYSMQQAKRDIDSVFSMGLFEDVKFLPQASEDSTLESPTVDLTLQVKEKKAGGLSAGFGMSAQVRPVLCPDLTAACSELCCSIGVCKTLPARCEAPHCSLDIASHVKQDRCGSQLASAY